MKKMKRMKLRGAVRRGGDKRQDIKPINDFK